MSSQRLQELFIKSWPNAVFNYTRAIEFKWEWIFFNLCSAATSKKEHSTCSSEHSALCTKKREGKKEGLWKSQLNHWGMLSKYYSDRDPVREMLACPSLYLASTHRMLRDLAWKMLPRTLRFHWSISSTPYKHLSAQYCHTVQHLCDDIYYPSPG